MDIERWAVTRNHSRLRIQPGPELPRQQYSEHGYNWIYRVGKTNLRARIYPTWMETSSHCYGFDGERGLFGGTSFFFDFQSRPGEGNSSLISSATTIGYSWDCCAVTAQNYTF